jgi:pimeloyl-ACP methyl ester carboxylesterase
VLKLLEDPNLSTAVLFGLSFPPTRAGIKGGIDYSAAVYAQYKRQHLPADSFTLSSKARAGQNNAAKQWRSKLGGVYKQLPKLTTRVLIMWGNLDIVEPTYNDRLIVSLLRHVTHRVFKGAGHGFLFQDAAAVGQAADRFTS